MQIIAAHRGELPKTRLQKNSSAPGVAHRGDPSELDPTGNSHSFPVSFASRVSNLSVNLGNEIVPDSTVN